ncbi:MAG: asparagine--tRNA ligase [Planctomycetota bacterium]|nr:MAG: asparagine--tRNA ligase [Planctomycetota bacterium]
MGSPAAPVVRIRELARHAGQDARLRGWVYNLRDKGRILFLLVRDGSAIAQGVIARGEVPDAAFEAARQLTQESSVELSGSVRADARAPGGAELIVKDMVVHQVAAPYPISPKEHGVAFLMQHRHLWLRSRKQAALLRVRHEVIQAWRNYLDAQGFYCVDSPIFTPNACEGTSTLFETDYFGEKAYLTQSGQLYAEAAAMALGKVYCFGPTFRAEKSKTRRHLTEFWMLEPEMAFAGLEENLALAEGLLRHTLRQVLEKRRDELADLERDPAVLEKWDQPFPRLRYDEAARQLAQWQKEGRYESQFRDGDDLGAPDETMLGRHFGLPVAVTHWPAAIKAFYMKRDPEDPTKVLGMDIVAPGAGEIVGGSVREDDLALLEQRIRDERLPEEAFQWYLDLRRYGSVPHAGFGIGLERTLSWITGVEHVRECIPFPRTLERIYP